MAQFYFDLHDESGLTVDEEGVELASETAARLMAIRGARSIMSAEIQSGRLDLSAWISVRMENGRVAFQLPFNQAVRVRPATS